MLLEVLLPLPSFQRKLLSQKLTHCYVSITIVVYHIEKQKVGTLVMCVVFFSFETLFCIQNRTAEAFPVDPNKYCTV